MPWASAVSSVRGLISIWHHQMRFSVVISEADDVGTTSNECVVLLRALL